MVLSVLQRCSLSGSSDKVLDASLSKVLWSSELMSVIATMSTSVISLEKENEALRLKVQELERKAMRQEVKVQERQSSTKKQRQ